MALLYLVVECSERRPAGCAAYAVAAHYPADGAVGVHLVETVAQFGVVIVKPLDLGGGGFVLVAEQGEVPLFLCDDLLPFLIHLPGILELCRCFLLRYQEQGYQAAGAGERGYELYYEVYGHGFALLKQIPSLPVERGTGDAGLSSGQ